MKYTEDIDRMIKKSKQSVFIYTIMGVFFLLTQSLTLILTDIDPKWSLALITLPIMTIILTIILIKRESIFTKKLISIKRIIEN